MRSAPSTSDSPRRGLTIPCRTLDSSPGYRDVEEGRIGRADANVERVVAQPGHRRHQLLLAVVPGAGAKGVVCREPRVQHDLRQLGPEHGPRVAEQRNQRNVKLRGVLEDPRRLVKQLQPLVLLPL